MFAGGVGNYYWGHWYGSGNRTMAVFPGIKICVNCLIACARAKVMWFSLVGLSWYVTCAMVLGLPVLAPLVAFARAVGGIFGSFSFARGVGLILFGLFVCCPGYGFVSYARDVGLVVFGLCASWHMVGLYRVDAFFLCL